VVAFGDRGQCERFTAPALRSIFAGQAPSTWWVDCQPVCSISTGGFVRGKAPAGLLVCLLQQAVDTQPTPAPLVATAQRASAAPVPPLATSATMGRRQLQASSTPRPPCAGVGTVLDDLYEEDDRLADDCFDPEPSATPSAAPSPSSTPSVTPSASTPVDNLADLVNGVRGNSSSKPPPEGGGGGVSTAFAAGLSLGFLLLLVASVFVARKVFKRLDEAAADKRRREKPAKQAGQPAAAGSARRRASVIAMQSTEGRDFQAAITAPDDVQLASATAASMAALQASSALFSGQTITEQMEAKRRKEEQEATASAAAMRRPRSTKLSGTPSSTGGTGDGASTAAYQEVFGRSRAGSLILGQCNPALKGGSVGTGACRMDGRSREASVAGATDSTVLRRAGGNLSGIAQEITAARGVNKGGAEAGSVRVNPLARAKGAVGAPSSSAVQAMAAGGGVSSAVRVHIRRERRVRASSDDANSPPLIPSQPPSDMGGSSGMHVFFPGESKQGPASGRSSVAAARKPKVSGHSGAVRIRRKR